MDRNSRGRRTIDEIYDGKSYYTKEEYKELLHIEDRANR